MLRRSVDLTVVAATLSCALLVDALGRNLISPLTASRWVPSTGSGYVTDNGGPFNGLEIINDEVNQKAGIAWKKKLILG